MLMALAEAFGPVAVATAKAQSSMARVANVYADLALRANTRLEAGGVGKQNETESEIQRRQVTRVGAQANLVGTQNATERAMKAFVVDAFVNEALRGVGSVNATQAEIYRRLAAAFVVLPSAPTGAGRL